jgi:hypothetical protein
MEGSSWTILYSNKKVQTPFNCLRNEIKTSQVKRDLGQASLMGLVSWVSIYILKISIPFFLSAETYYLEIFYLRLWFTDTKM